MKFSEIPALDSEKADLIKSVNKGKIAHAQLFFGKLGSAALPMALAYSSYINCEKPSEIDSCGECSSCVKMKKLSHPDLRIIFPTAGGQKVSSADFMNDFRTAFADNYFINPSNWLEIIDKKSGNIPVAESRKLIQELSYKAYEAKYKISIIWQAEKMNIAAANALLKIIEEPPSDTVFLFISYDADSLLSTIISRTQPVRIPSYVQEEINGYLLNSKNLNAREAEQIAFQAEGDISNAIELIESNTFETFDWFSNWMRYSFKYNFRELIPFSDEFDSLKKEQQINSLAYGLKIFRQITLYGYGATNLLNVNEEQLKFIQNFSKVIQLKNLGAASELIDEAIFHIERNAKAKIVFLDLSLKIAQQLRS